MKHQNRSSILITAAVASAVLAVLIGGFLTFISNEYSLNLRSHAWNQALHIAEAGVETAFAEFNYYHTQAGAGFSSSRGWISLGGGDYYYPVPNLYDNKGRQIGSMYAYVRGVGSDTPWVSGYGACPTTPRGPAVWRRVDVGLQRSGYYPKGIVAKMRLIVKGDYNGVFIDSYDSSDPAKSTTNVYDSAKRQANGDVGCAGFRWGYALPMLALGNSSTYGRVLYTTNSIVTLGPYGSIGATLDPTKRIYSLYPPPMPLPAGWFEWLRSDFHVDIPDPVLPSGATSWPSLGLVTNSITLTTGDYQATRVGPIRGKVVTIAGKVRLYVTGNFDFTVGKLVIEPNGSLEAYIGRNCFVANNAVNNRTKRPVNCQLYGLGGMSDTWYFGGAGSFIGTVYAPNCWVTVGGGDDYGEPSEIPSWVVAGDAHFSGSLVGGYIFLCPRLYFHYDESLRGSGPNAAGYNMAWWKSWRWDSSRSTWVAD